MVVFLLLLPALCFAANVFPEPDPSQVLIVYNEASTLDTDNDGVYDHRQIIEKLWEIRGDTSNILGINTEITYNTESHAQAIHVDLMHYGLDVSSPYGESAGQNVTGAEEYILQEIAEWFDADSINRWGTVIYIELLMGMPLKIRGNDNVGQLPEDAEGDSTLYRSVASWIWTYLAPGAEENTYFDDVRVSKRHIGNPYCDQVEAGDWQFYPGVLKTYATGILSVIDTFRLWVALPTLLDGNHVDDVLGMLDRSETKIIQSSGVADADYWAVFDEANGSAVYKPIQSYTGLPESLDVIFPSRTLADIDSVPAAAGTDTVFVGWTGDVTLQSGDTCALYFTAASKHSPRPSTSNRWYYNIEFPIAPGAITWVSESYASYTIRDTSLRPPGEGTQTLICEAIENGFTYAVGNCYEPFGNGIPDADFIVNALRIPHLPFALMASAALGETYGCLYSHVAVGPAIGFFRPAITGTGEAATFSGNCSEVVSYSATMPAVADSILFHVITTDGDTNITRVNTSPGGSVNQTLGTRWASKPTEKVLVTIVDTENNHHTTEFIAP